MQVTISVRDLATFVHRRGDIDDRADNPTTAREGIDTQRSYQDQIKQANANYETEVRVSEEWTEDAITLHVSGRADGVSVDDELDGKRLLVEEIKTTRKPVHDIPLCDRSVNEAQLRLYAAMLRREHDVSSITARLTYIHPDTGDAEQLDQDESDLSLEGYFEDTAHRYCEWVKQVVDRVQQRNNAASKQAFPYPSYNQNQLQLARHGFMSLRDEANLLMEAPTGTGKTMAAAFPAVKAMGEKELDRVVFATARTTGQQAAAEAFGQLQAQNDALVQVTVSAKERVCLTPGAACRPEECEYAKGHYDRVRDAAANLMRRRHVTRSAIDAVAKSDKVCPFELSLDVAEWSDAVICDYNYVFDPLVQLSRLHSRLFSRVGLLVDEAHRVTERVRDMLSCRFDLDAFENAMEAIPGSVIGERLQNILRLLENILASSLPSDGEIALNDIDLNFMTLVERFFDANEPIPNSSQESDVVRQAIYTLFRLRAIWPICEDNQEKFVWLLTRSEQARLVELRCLLPDGWIRDVVESYHGSIRFSGTLSPGELFNEEHGLEGPIKLAKLAPNARRLSVQLVPDISTYYNERQLTAPRLAQLIDQVQEVSQGNWLVAFPSFVYLELVLSQVANSEAVIAQKSQMSLEEREDFLNQLALDSGRMAFVVMGGVFTESIDIEQTSLEGVMVISPGIPPRSLERERLLAVSPNGYEIAYRRPAMTRVIQAAGRVVRGEKDRGVVVLVDPRFTRSEFGNYFPSHWQPQIVKSENLIENIAAFQGEIAS